MSDECKNFVPPFCPDQFCECHESPSGQEWYVLNGQKNGIRQFICRKCLRCFSESSFRREYYEKKNLDYRKIVAVGDTGITLKEWAGRMRTTPPTLKLRLHKIVWLLLEELDRAGKSKLSCRLLTEYQLVSGKGLPVYRILRELIMRYKKLLLKVLGYAASGRRCFIDHLRQNLLIKLRAVIGAWNWPKGRNFRWDPCHPIDGGYYLPQ